MLYTFYLLIPFTLILAIILVAVYYKIKGEKSIIEEVYGIFIKTWENGKAKAEAGGESFDQLFLRLFRQEYEYEQFKISENKNKYLLLKTLVLVVIASIPFLMMLLVNKKDFILGKNEWNDIYLYTIIAVPIIFAFLLNKYISVRRYREMWIQDTKIKQHMEWRMMMLIKDYEMKKRKMNAEESNQLLDSLKNSFIDDMCEYWRISTTEFSDKVLSKEENLFQEIGKLFETK